MKKINSIRIGNHIISDNSKPLFIAEMSGNHNQSLIRALSIVDKAAQVGANIIKLQTYTPDTMTLDLKNNDLSDKAVIALSKSEKLKRLVSLNLSQNNISDAGAKALANSNSLEKLKKLDLNFNRIGDEGAFAIAESPNFSSLESLKLGQNKIGTTGAQALNKSKILQNLIHPIFGFY